MALQVWLPLTKDLSNQGLYNCSITDKGATYSSSVGKLGGSYMFNPESSQSGTKYLLLNATTADIFQSGQSFSLACWFMLTGSLYSNGCGLITGNVYANKGIGLLLWNNSGNTKVCVQMCFDGTEREWKPNITAFSQNVWYHICFTYEQPTRKLSLYINGSLVDSLIETRDWVAHTTQKIAIGRGTQGGWEYTLPGYMNDARIYDHCLSPKEVKEISQGLVLHYKLDDAGLKNLIADGWGGTDNWYNQNQIFEDVPDFPQGITNSYGPQTSKEYIPINPSHTYMMSGYTKRGRSSTNYLYLTLLPYDMDKNFIYNYQCASGFYAVSKTTLAQDLHDGDSVLYLTDASKWSTTLTHGYYVAIFGYQSSTGYTYPDMTYTRRVYSFGTTTDKSNLDIPNNRVTLRQPYSGSTIPAGTCVCQSSEGAIYYYPSVYNSSSVDSDTWVHLASTFVPQNLPRLSGTAFVRSYGALYNNQRLAGITLIDLGYNFIKFNMSSSNYTQSNYASRTSSNITNGIYHVDGYQSSSSIDTSFSAISNTYITLDADTDYYLSFYCNCKAAGTLYFGPSTQSYTGLRDSSNTYYRPASQFTLGTEYSGLVVLKLHTGSDTQYKILLGFDTPNLFGEGSFIEFYGVSLTKENPREAYDCSGYGHHGEYMAQLTSDLSSPRYGSCINNTIEYPLKTVMEFPESKGLTIACWMKLSKWGRQASGLWATSTNSTTTPSDYDTTTCNHRDAAWGMKGVSTSVKRLSCTSSDVPLNQWKHVVLTHDGSNAKLYIDGSYVRQVALADSLVGFKSLFLGWSQAGGAERKCKGSWSDFRLYATALSDEDIKELYNTPTNIDNYGNMHTFEFAEDDVTDEQILKTGLTKADMFVEKYFESLYDETDAEFTDRTIPSEAQGDVLKATAVKGKSVVWNQILQINTNAGPWTSNGVTMVNNRDGSYTFNGTATGSGFINGNNRPKTFVSQGHKYYIFVSKNSLDIYFTATAFNFTTIEGSRYTRYIATSDRDGNPYMRLSVVSGVTYNNVTVWPYIIDLTQMFGAGNEPTTVEEFEALYPLHYYDYNPGELVNNAASGVETLSAGGNSLGTIPLNITGLTSNGVQIFPDGMKSAGTAYDEWSGTTATKRIGVVDLGTLNWSISGGTFFTTVLSAVIKNKTSTLLCDKYTTNNGNVVIGSMPDKSVGSTSGGAGVLWIKDSSYTSAADFKAAMSGVLLYYELKEPVTYTVDALPDALVPFDAQGTQRRLPVDTSEEVAAPMVCDFQYGKKINKCNLQIYKDRIEANQLIEK